VAGKDVAFSAPAKRVFISYGLQPAVFSFRTDRKDTLIMPALTKVPKRPADKVFLRTGFEKL